LYQKIDSLEVAKTEYEWVTKDYPRSEYAERAIKNASNIAQLIRLRDSEGQDNPESQALRLLSLAEMQLFQFDNAEKALESYQKLLADYPQSEVAPKAGYAVAYVYEVVLGDSVKAREAYRTLIRDYPDSQQAALAREALGLPPVPPVEREAVRPEEEAGEAGESASVEGTRSP
jgi:tetratricopeptide (TPR) repeat protein